MYVAEPVRVAAAAVTIDAMKLLGISAISGDVAVYKGNAIVAANKIASCTAAQGHFTPSFPIDVNPPSPAQAQAAPPYLEGLIHVTVSGGSPEAIILVSR